MTPHVLETFPKQFQYSVADQLSKSEDNSEDNRAFMPKISREDCEGRN